MFAACCGARELSPVFGSASAPSMLSNSADIIDPVRSNESLPIDDPLKCQLPEGALMGIIFNLEQERETYLEAVSVLHEQLQEAHEHYQQLSESHQQMKVNLEAEVSEGWKEAERWEAKYHSVTNAALSAGIDISKLEPKTIENPVITRERSLLSDACTVVTRADLELIPSYKKKGYQSKDVHDYPGMYPTLHDKVQGRQIMKESVIPSFGNDITSQPSCFCLTPMGSPCVRCTDDRAGHKLYTEPMGVVYGEWLYLGSPRANVDSTKRDDIASAMGLVLDATSI
ncbi:hypothetical protein BBOV_III004790 [Babesia bovis T2Bo]|uniref:Uncharacterized protein n=1 Tax=Babesia bovis TaxID=5865 RepID=A7ANA8_BABBO|nr:hypothetical protein BBOV_III004790 [Babesia bovis T2Bo]EDO08042.1 hypothetical protein BBOV_III004790 [Babesia bovis T2Bo]|eukprot:XP_001611610.1 hypothetical protein [Babesia bovis T2Bo]